MEEMKTWRKTTIPKTIVDKMNLCRNAVLCCCHRPGYPVDNDKIIKTWKSKMNFFRDLSVVTWAKTSHKPVVLPYIYYMYVEW